MALISFQDALKQTNSPRILLLGNGFSRACMQARFPLLEEEKNPFSYDSLAKKTGDSKVENLFENLGTYDFEEVIQEIKFVRRTLIIMNHIGYDFSEKIKELNDEEEKLKKYLIDAIKSIHPLKSSELPEDTYKTCWNFLQQFDVIYTINYDLLLYWVQMNNKTQFKFKPKSKFSDGFWDKTFSNKVNYWDPYCPKTNLFYLHGALHLFCDDSPGKHIYKLIYGPDLVSQIEEKVRNNNYPLYVTEGNWHDKLKKIQSNDYLRNAYSSLRKRQGVIFTFGTSFGKDDHLLDVIGSSQVTKIFIGARDNNESKLDKVKDKLLSYGKEINIYSTSFSIW